MKSFKPGTRVEVTWLDAASDFAGWVAEPHCVPSKDTLGHCQTVGYLVRHDETALVLAMSRCNEKRGGWWAIPSSTVLKVRRIR